MNRSIILIQLVLFLSLSFLATLCLAQTNSPASSNETENANYILVKYVIGSGGTAAANSNYSHVATAGETIAGGAFGANNFLFSGYWTPVIHIPTKVAESELTGLPTSFALYQNYPNPFNPQTDIRYDLPGKCLVTVEIFNAIGQRIKLVSSQIQGPGNVQVEWYGRDDQGKLMGSGIYLYRITAYGNDSEQEGTNIMFQQTKKMLLVK